MGNKVAWWVTMYEVPLWNWGRNKRNYLGLTGKAGRNWIEARLRKAWEQEGTGTGSGMFWGWKGLIFSENNRNGVDAPPHGALRKNRVRVWYVRPTSWHVVLKVTPLSHCMYLRGSMPAHMQKYLISCWFIFDLNLFAYKFKLHVQNLFKLSKSIRYYFTFFFYSILRSI